MPCHDRVRFRGILGDANVVAPAGPGMVGSGPRAGGQAGLMEFRRGSVGRLRRRRPRTGSGRPWPGSGVPSPRTGPHCNDAAHVHCPRRSCAIRRKEGLGVEVTCSAEKCRRSLAGRIARWGARLGRDEGEPVVRQMASVGRESIAVVTFPAGCRGGMGSRKSWMTLAAVRSTSVSVVPVPEGPTNPVIVQYATSRLPATSFWVTNQSGADVAGVWTAARGV